MSTVSNNTHVAIMGLLHGRQSHFCNLVKGLKKMECTGRWKEHRFRKPHLVCFWDFVTHGCTATLTSMALASHAGAKCFVVPDRKVYGIEACYKVSVKIYEDALRKY